MLDRSTIKKVEEFVYSKPRTIQEIAAHINRNWRTADRYVDDIQREFGTISTRTFRKGTRGALKIAYWTGIERAQVNIFQKKLEHEIVSFKKKEDFSAFDIYQHVSQKKKKTTLFEIDDESKADLEELSEFILKTKEQLLVFSGNLSFIHLHNKKADLFKTLEKLVKNKIPIKIICKVDYSSYRSIKKLLSLNSKYGGELIQIRHSEQPVRGLLRDQKEMRLKEVKEPTKKINEPHKRMYIFYTIKDMEWSFWLGKVFWKIFSNSIDSTKRMEELETLFPKRRVRI